MIDRERLFYLVIIATICCILLLLILEVFYLGNSYNNLVDLINSKCIISAARPALGLNITFGGN